MSESILNSTKKVLHVSESDTSFDVDIMMHINSVFNTLNDIGIGPEDGFMIEDETTTWDEFLLDDKNLNSVKTLMYLQVKLDFDPPATSFGITAMEKQIDQQVWRLNVRRETREWRAPVEPIVLAGTVIDGGDA